MFLRLAAAEFFIKFQKIVNWRSKLFVESGHEVLTVVCVAGEECEKNQSMPPG